VASHKTRQKIIEERTTDRGCQCRQTAHICIYHNKRNNGGHEQITVNGNVILSLHQLLKFFIRITAVSNNVINAIWIDDGHDHINSVVSIFVRFSF